MTRRESLKNMAYFLWLPLSWMVYQADDRQREKDKASSVVRISKDIPEGISFSGAVIISKNKDKIQFLSSACTHLGCRIQKEEMGVIICPCHGSRYDSEGHNILGPATQPLEKLAFHKDASSGDYLVNTLTD